MKSKFKVVTDAMYGSKRLDPIPSEKELDQYYTKKYYSLAEERYRAPQLKRFMQGGKVAESEKAWYAATLWTDVRDVLSRSIKKKNKTLLDIGTGTGFFAHFMQKSEWAVTGIEPSLDAAEKARKGGIKVYASVDEYLENKNAQKFDAITLLNVLEHVPKPVKIIKQILPLLKKDGVLVIQVPNDFSPLQILAQKKLKKQPWWLAIPDHIHYYGWNSLNKLMTSLGLEVTERLSDFPMELFLLMGDDYVGNPDVGAQCHKKRVQFDLALPAEFRRSIYKALASANVGRNCMVFARLKK